MVKRAPGCTTLSCAPSRFVLRRNRNKLLGRWRKLDTALEHARRELPQCAECKRHDEGTDWCIECRFDICARCMTTVATCKECAARIAAKQLGVPVGTLLVLSVGDHVEQRRTRHGVERVVGRSEVTQVYSEGYQLDDGSFYRFDGACEDDPTHSRIVFWHNGVNL